MRVAVLKAAFDEDAHVWYVESSDIEGLHVEGDTFEAFRRNVADAAADLLEGDGTGEVHIGSSRTPPSAPAPPREGLRQAGP